MTRNACVSAVLILSVRINERPARRVKTAPGTELSPSSIARMESSSKDNKKIAYLLDLENIRVVDLATGITVATVNHDSKVRCSRAGRRSVDTWRVERDVYRTSLRQRFLGVYPNWSTFAVANPSCQSNAPPVLRTTASCTLADVATVLALTLTWRLFLVPFVCDLPRGAPAG